MKRFIYVFLILLFCVLNVQAKTIKVVSLEHFSTRFPSTTYNVQVVQTEYIENGFFLEKGTIISGCIIKVKRPRLGNRDSYFEFQPTLLTFDGKSINVSQSNMVGRIVGIKHIDPGKIAGKLAINATNFLLLGASPLISFTMGATDAEAGEKMKGGLERIYTDSLIYYIKSGKELNIDVGDELILKIKKTR